MVERADITSVLTQMREMQMQAQAGVGSNPVQDTRGVGETEASQFSGMFKNAVDGVNTQQQDATALQTAYEMGDPGVDLTQVMISMQKASLSFQALTQVRNRLVAAYEDIMNMPL